MINPLLKKDFKQKFFLYCNETKLVIRSSKEDKPNIRIKRIKIESI